MGNLTCGTERFGIMNFVIPGVLESDRSAKIIFPPQKPAKYLHSCEDEDYWYEKETASANSHINI